MPPDAEPAIEAAIARGQADVRESKVTPHPAVARLVRAASVADAGAPAARAVVWSEAARDVLVARVQSLATDDPQAAATFADTVDRTARALGQAACGADGLLPHTYEKIVPGRPCARLRARHLDQGRRGHRHPPPVRRSTRPRSRTAAVAMRRGALGARG